MPLPTYTSYQLAKNPVVISSAKHQHQVSRIHLPGSRRSWIKKDASGSHQAREEILANEFFRLIIKGQTESQLLLDPETHVYCVVSEEIFGFKRLPVDWVKQLAAQSYPGLGLGQIMVCALFLQELDLKHGNVGVDEEMRIYKIDGDLCFGSLKHKDPHYRFAITKETIGALPTPFGFHVINWLDDIKESKDHHWGCLSFLSSDPNYRAEVNEALLAILLLPDFFLQRFVEYYMPAEDADAPDGNPGPYLDFFMRYQKELSTAALEDPSFCSFMQSSDIQSKLNTLLDRLTSFMVNNAPLLSPEEQTLFRKDAMLKFPQIMLAVISIQQQTIEMLMKIVGNYALNPNNQPKASFFHALLDKNHSFSTLLHAAYEGNLNLVTQLIAKNRALLTQQNSNGQTVIMYAARAGHLDIVSYLFMIGGRKLLVQQDKDGYTALLSTITLDMCLDSVENHFKEEEDEFEPQHDVLEWLIERSHPRDLAHKDRFGWNICVHVLKGTNLGALTFLIQKGTFEFVAREVATAKILFDTIQNMNLSDKLERNAIKQLYFEAKRGKIPLEWFSKVPQDKLDTFDYKREKVAASYLRNFKFYLPLKLIFNQQECKWVPHLILSYFKEAHPKADEDDYLTNSDMILLYERQTLLEEQDAAQKSYDKSFEQAQLMTLAPQLAPQLLWSQLDNLCIAILAIESQLGLKKSRPYHPFLEEQRKRREREWETSAKPAKICQTVDLVQSLTV